MVVRPAVDGELGLAPRRDRARSACYAPSTPRGNKLFRSPPMVGGMEWARTEIVGGIVTSVLMKYRTKTAMFWTEAIRRYGEGRRRTSWSRRIPDRAEDRRPVRRPVGRGRFLLCVRCWLHLDRQERQRASLSVRWPLAKGSQC